MTSATPLSPDAASAVDVVEVDCSGCGPGCTADRIRAQGLFQAEGWS
jgi:hypothetical protein